MEKNRLSIGVHTCVVFETGARVGEKKSRVSRRVCTPTLDTLGQRLFKSSWEFAELSRLRTIARRTRRTRRTNEPSGRSLYLAPWLKTPASSLVSLQAHPQHSFYPSHFFTLGSFGSLHRVAPGYRINSDPLIPLCEHNDPLRDRLITRILVTN